MKRSTTEKGYAKINLLLDIAGVREDGYHLIDGVMQTISLADLLEVEFEESEKTEIKVKMTGYHRHRIDPMFNLAYRAAERFLTRAGIAGTVRIKIEKNIPICSGLAGGSADAAAVLRALNRLFDNRFSVEDLCAIGKGLGADVPFCIRGGAMRTQGIGEKLTPCVGLTDCYVVVVRADLIDLDLKTEIMYHKLDEVYDRFVGYPDPAPRVEYLMQLLRKGNLQGACCRLENVFENVVFRYSDGWLPDLKARLQQQDGALGTLMSGSGSAIYSVFKTKEHADLACRILGDRPAYDAWVCEPLSQEFSVC